jgi:hypothetical protein
MMRRRDLADDVMQDAFIQRFAKQTGDPNFARRPPYSKVEGVRLKTFRFRTWTSVRKRATLSGKRDLRQMAPLCLNMRTRGRASVSSTHLNKE